MIQSPIPLIDNPEKIIDELIRLGMGDQGRLLYLKSALKKNHTVYQTDRKFLRTMYEKLEERKNQFHEKNRNDLKSNKTKSLLHERVLSQDGRLNVSSYEKNFAVIINEISKLRDSDALILQEIQQLKTLTNRPTNFMESSETITSQHKSQKSSVRVDSKEQTLLGKKYFNGMIFAASGCLILWYAGYVRIIDIANLDEVFLGGFIGFVSAAIIIKKLLKTIIPEKWTEKIKDVKESIPLESKLTNKSNSKDHFPIDLVEQKKHLEELQSEMRVKINDVKNRLDQINMPIHSIKDNISDMYMEHDKISESFLWADKFLQDSEWAKSEGDALVLKNQFEDAFYKYQFSFNMAKKSQEHIDKIKNYLNASAKFHND